jgi:uncharacterized protein YecT (DUF1311 family)
MNAYLVRLLMLAAVGASLTFGAGDDEHPIDRESAQCFDKANTTAAMTACAGNAVQAWIREVSKTLEELLSLVEPGRRASIEAGQAAWLKWLAAESESIAAVYSQMGGTIGTVMGSQDRAALVRNRALELKKYCELLRKSRE